MASPFHQGTTRLSKDASLWREVTGMEPTQGVTGRFTRINRPRPMNHTPDVPVNDPRYLMFQSRLFEEFSREYPISNMVDGGFEPPAIPKGFDHFKNLMMYPSNPMGTTPFDVRGLRLSKFRDAKGYDPKVIDDKELELFLEPSEADISVCRMVTDILVQLREAQAVPAKKGTSYGAPHFSTDLLLKHASVDELRKIDRLERFCQLIISLNLLGLRDEFQWVILYGMGYRGQSDKLGKTRKVLDIHGRVVVQDREVPTEYGRYGHARYRTRQVNMAPFGVAYLLRLLAKMVDAYMYSVFSAMFDTSTGAVLDEFVSKLGYFEQWDVGNHDYNIPYLFRDVFIEHSFKFGSVYGWLTFLLFNAPDIVQNDYEESSGARFRGNPLDIDDFKAVKVNPSGIPWTSVVARWATVVYLVMACIKHGVCVPSREGIIELLMHRTRIRFKIAGDNVCIGDTLGDKKLIVSIREALPYVIFEESTTFVGMVPRREVTGFTHWVHSPVSQTNWFANEKSIYDPNRLWWAHGWFTRKDVFSDNGENINIDYMMNDVYRSIFKHSYDSVAFASPSRILPTGVQSYSLIDMEFILKPEVVYYKFDVAQISRGLRDFVFFTIPAEVNHTMYVNSSKIGDNVVDLAKYRALREKHGFKLPTTKPMSHYHDDKKEQRAA